MALNTLQQGKMLGGAVFYVVEMKGKFETSMGGINTQQDDWSTIGIVCKINRTELVTIKMTGPISETSNEKENLIQFAENLKFISFPEDQQ